MAGNGGDGGNIPEYASSGGAAAARPVGKPRSQIFCKTFILRSRLPTTSLRERAMRMEANLCAREEARACSRTRPLLAEIHCEHVRRDAENVAQPDGVARTDGGCGGQWMSEAA